MTGVYPYGLEFVALALAAFAFVFVIRFNKRVKPWALLFDASFIGMTAAMDTLMGNVVLACVNGADAALFLYYYFKNGGGKGTRRRLKAALERFKPVRRTAPVEGA